jgi:hypothetical protein
MDKRLEYIPASCSSSGVCAPSLPLCKCIWNTTANATLSQNFGNAWTATPISRKGDRDMETTADGTFFQEGDHVRLKGTGETGRINATAGGVVYVLMNNTNENRLFAAYVDEDAAIELVAGEAGHD